MKTQEEVSFIHGIVAERLCEILGYPNGGLTEATHGDVIIRLEIAIREDRLSRDELFRFNNWLSKCKKQLETLNFIDNEECLEICKRMSALCCQKLQ